MTDTDKILQKLEQQGRKIDEQGRQLTHLQTDVTSMKVEVEKIPAMQQQLSNLELNIEAFRVEQRQTNDELLSHIITSNDVNDKEQQALEKRVDRVEKHLNLPPMK